MEIRQFSEADRGSIVALWARCGLTRPWNDPDKDIDRKLAESPELFFVGIVDEHVVATAMAGYDGHRGWVNYLAVDPSVQSEGYGREIMNHIEGIMHDLGCPKINIQIRNDNADAIGFYEAVGYRRDAVVSLGKRLVED